MRLVGDIGGTNARFGIAEPGNQPSNVRKLAIAQYPGLVEAVQDYLSGVPMLDEAVLAVAGPIVGDEVAFSNSAWRFSIEDVRIRLGLRRLVIINDLVAHALSVASLSPDEIGALKSGTRDPRQPVLVIGPGTGLGVAFLLNNAGTLVGVPSEAGHATFAPTDRVQTEILARLQGQHGHVPVERLLSGPGLLVIARTLAEINGQNIDVRDPRDVSARAATGECAICRETMKIFSSILGSTAGNLALTLLTRGGVFITGGLCRGLRPLLDRDKLTHAFIAKGPLRSHLEDIPIDQILRPHAALSGAAKYVKPSGGS
ncbi:glucokinase [Bradyrhizobium sp. LHD-71]|uniref:glucokinase n=1 Tax=Bradyrhizobium sp. LHD-71 TaxID=3072141 RepID=UPI00280EFD75|nr:glucokinase [Bradyrhizobium sp. LHD-71]MDQ8731097.1 glucokinase [Bradyrhizobium sp. LHD-71]